MTINSPQQMLVRFLLTRNADVTDDDYYLLTTTAYRLSALACIWLVMTSWDSLQYLPQGAKLTWNLGGAGPDYHNFVGITSSYVCVKPIVGLQFLRHLFVYTTTMNRMNENVTLQKQPLILTALGDPLQWRSQGGGQLPPPMAGQKKKFKIDISDFEVSCAVRDALFSSYTLLKDDITV